MARPTGNQIGAVRAFSRFYTKRIGALNEYLLGSGFSLSEVRVMYEISSGNSIKASDIADTMSIDRGYLSRLLASLTQRGLIRKSRSCQDGRESILSLTRSGASVFSGLDKAASLEVGVMLEALRKPGRALLVESMATIRQLLADESDALSPIKLRSHRPGDMGWVIKRHGEIYASEYGWDVRFEALVAGVVARFVRELKPARERCWIAERGGVNIGCVFLVERSKKVAQLRLLLVEPHERGNGLGQRLVKECIAFSRDAGYRRMRLWTNDVLISARRIYEAAGFNLIEEESHASWGKPLTSQTWELRL